MAERTTLDLNATNVFEHDMSVEQVRSLIDAAGTESVNDDLFTEMDKAQGHVHSGEASEAYVVIKITK